MGCVRETPQIKMKLDGMLKRESTDKNGTSTGSVRETPRIRKRSQHGMCKRNFTHKNKARMGYERKTPQIKKKPPRDV